MNQTLLILSSFLYLINLTLINHSCDLAMNMTLYVAKLQVHNIVSSNKVISQVSFLRGLDKTSTKIIVNLQLFEKSIKLKN